MLSIVKMIVSSSVSKHSFLFTLLAIVFGVNLYLVGIHSFSVFEFQDNYSKVRYIEYFYMMLIYSAVMVFGVNVYDLVDCVISRYIPQRYESDKRNPRVPYRYLKNIALYQSNLSAYYIYKECKASARRLNNRLFVSFLFVVLSCMDSVLHWDKSIVGNIYRNGSDGVRVACVLLVLYVLASIVNIRKDDGFYTNRFSLFDVQEDVGRVVLKTYWDSYDRFVEEENKRHNEALLPRPLKPYEDEHKL